MKVDEGSSSALLFLLVERTFEFNATTAMYPGFHWWSWLCRFSLSHAIRTGVFLSRPYQHGSPAKLQIQNAKCKMQNAEEMAVYWLVMAFAYKYIKSSSDHHAFGLEIALLRRLLRLWCKCTFWNLLSSLPLELDQPYYFNLGHSAADNCLLLFDNTRLITYLLQFANSDLLTHLD